MVTGALCVIVAGVTKKGRVVNFCSWWLCNATPWSFSGAWCDMAVITWCQGRSTEWLLHLVECLDLRHIIPSQPYRGFYGLGWIFCLLCILYFSRSCAEVKKSYRVTEILSPLSFPFLFGRYTFIGPDIEKDQRAQQVDTDSQDEPERNIPPPT